MKKCKTCRTCFLSGTEFKVSNLTLLANDLSDDFKIMNEIYCITAGNTSVFVTAEHLVYLDVDTTVTIEDLKVGDIISSSFGGSEVTSKVKLNGYFKVYTIDNEDKPLYVGEDELIFADKCMCK